MLHISYAYELRFNVEIVNTCRPNCQVSWKFDLDERHYAFQNKTKYNLRFPSIDFRLVKRN